MRMELQLENFGAEERRTVATWIRENPKTGQRWLWAWACDYCDRHTARGKKLRRAKREAIAELQAQGFFVSVPKAQLHSTLEEKLAEWRLIGGYPAWVEIERVRIEREFGERGEALP